MRKFLLFTLLFCLSAGIIQAQDQTIAPGDTIEGEAVGAVVPYSFEAQEGDDFTFDIETDFSALLTVENEAGEVLADNDAIRFFDLPILFTAPEDGTYTLIVGTAFGEPEGAFTLSMTGAEVAPIEYGASVDLTPQSELVRYFDFQGVAGDVLNIYANSQDDDTVLYLLSPSGAELARDDDSGPGLDPYIRRYTLPADSRYVVALSALSERSPMQAPITLNLEQTEALPVSAEVTSVELGSDIVGSSDVEIFVFEGVEAGGVYRITIETDRTDGSVNLDIMQGEDEISRSIVDAFSRLAVDVVARSGSPFTITLDHNGFGGDAVTYNVTMEPVE
jgi:hypothetical protein